MIASFSLPFFTLKHNGGPESNGGGPDQHTRSSRESQVLSSMTRSIYLAQGLAQSKNSNVC